MNRRTFQGYLFGIISGIAYGLNPFFAKPMLDCGIDVNTILLFRYLLTAILMAVIMGFCRYSFRIKREQIFVTIVLGICFSLSSFFLFEAYKYISSGVATTIVFLYPIMVAIILLFFKEYPSWQVWLAIVLCLLGVAFFSFGEENTSVNFFGIILSSLSAFSYAVYMVIAEKSSSIKQMPLISLMFFVSCFGSLIYPLFMEMGGDFPFEEIGKVLQIPSLFLNALGLAIFPTAVSMLTLIASAKRIGSVKASIFGVLEPVTAIAVGIFVFKEPMTRNIFIGLFLIFLAISMMVISSKNKAQNEERV